MRPAFAGCLLASAGWLACGSSASSPPQDTSAHDAVGPDGTPVDGGPAADGSSAANEGGSPAPGVTAAWAKMLGPSVGSAIVATDPAGNVDFAARGGSSVDLGGGNLVDPIVQAFEAQFDPTGTPLWWGAGYARSDHWYQHIAADPSGAIVATGWAAGTSQYSGIEIPCQSAPVVQFDPSINFIVKENPVPTNGCVWSHAFAGTVNGLAVDSNGNVLVAGGGQIAAGNATGTVLAKYDSAGNAQWIVSDTTEPWMVAGDVAVDDAGSAYVVGEDQNLQYALAKYDGAGALVWHNAFHGMSSVPGQPGSGYAPGRVAVDRAGDVAIAIDFHNTIDLGGGPLTAAPGGYSFAVALFDGAGNHRWSRAFAVAQDPSLNGTGAGASIVFAADGQVVVAGSYYTTIDLGLGPLPKTTITHGDRDVFLAAFDGSGATLWSTSYGEPHTNSVNDMVADASGAVILVGTFTDAIDFGSGRLVAPPRGPGSWGTTFLAKLVLH
jgi:hypothetical protein